MLCWPFFADQPTNCRYIYNEWEIGIEIDTNVKREEVEKLVNDLMAGEKGKKMRQKIVELKKKAEEATTPSGCSFMNLDKIIKEVRCTNSVYCSENGVTAVITDQASSDNTDFILGKHAFSRMAQTTDAAASLLALGVLDIDFNIDGIATSA
ncbi:hypothetical protein JHK87_050705 [Glycine soja]|nr:hypothetical protein JHK87_050705 [Glycine soja]